MKMYEGIHVSDHETYMKSENWRRNWISENRPPEELVAHDKRIADREAQRQAILAKFPYSVILAGVYPEHDFVSRWCWQNIGVCDGKCTDGPHSEYTGCPVVLATEYISKSSWKDKEGKDHLWEEKAYLEVEEHSHEGSWTSFWLGKTGYDYGLGEYCFATESDRDRFLAAEPTFNTGEKYNKENENE